MPSQSALQLTDTLLALPRPAKRLLAMCVDICLCVLTVWLVLCFRHETWVTIQGYQWLAVIVSPLLAIPLFITFGLYRAIFRFAGREALEAVARAVGIYALMYSAIFTTTSFQDVPRTIGVLQPALLLLSVAAVRMVARHLLGEPYIAELRSLNAANVLIYGAGSSGLALASSLSKSQAMRVVGFLDDNPSLHRGQLMGIDVYSPQDLVKLVERLHVHDVLLALPSITRQRRNEILKAISTARVAVRTLPTLSDLALGRVQADDLRELDIEDLLGRDAVAPDLALMQKNILGKVVLVTGAGGSIGSELCRQILRIQPRAMVLVELNELALYTILEELNTLSTQQTGATARLVPILASVQDEVRIMEIIKTWQPHTIYHAAAYKHVPLVESNPVAGIHNNILGTLHVAKAAIACDVPDMALISTDKAVRPTNVMGATKRVAEMILQALAYEAAAQGKSTKLCMVRFGNVLGSSGSVVPKFRQQIRSGGPISVTHPDVTRFFMTIPEAAQLVIQAAAMPSALPKSAEVFVLDMGEPVKIMDLARSMVELSGMTVREANGSGDIAIEITGMRPGEKLYEELLIGSHPQTTSHPKIMRADEQFTPWPILEGQLNQLFQLTPNDRFDTITSTLQSIVEQYEPAMHERIIEAV